MTENKQSISILQQEDGYVYCTYDPKKEKFGKALNIDKVESLEGRTLHLGLKDSKFGLVPKDIEFRIGKKSWPKELLESKKSQVQTKLKNFAHAFIFEAPLALSNNPSGFKINHLGQVFLDWIQMETHFPEVHIAHLENTLYIAATEDFKLKFFNLFEAITPEEVAYYPSAVYDNLEFKRQAVPLKVYGETSKELLKIVCKELGDLQFMNQEDTPKEFFLKRLVKCE